MEILLLLRQYENKEKFDSLKTVHGTVFGTPAMHPTEAFAHFRYNYVQKIYRKYEKLP